jgi:hypothetical protein
MQKIKKIWKKVKKKPGELGIKAFIRHTGWRNNKSEQEKT